MRSINCCKGVKIKTWCLVSKESAPITAKQLKRLCADSLPGRSANRFNSRRISCATCIVKRVIFNETTDLPSSPLPFSVYHHAHQANSCLPKQQIELQVQRVGCRRILSITLQGNKHILHLLDKLHYITKLPNIHYYNITKLLLLQKATNRVIHDSC